jgi:DNA-binding CsgD family transcriptional regulator
MRNRGESKQKATARPGLIETTLKMWPALPYLGLGFWLAWSVLAYSGGVWLSDVETSGENISKLFVSTSIAFSLATLAAVLKNRLASQLIKSRAFLLLAGALGAAGSLLVVASGPYYIGALIGVEAYPIFILGGVLTGVASSVLLLKCATLYSVLTPRRVMLFLSLSNLLMACVYFIVIGVPSWHPVMGGPPVSGIVALILVMPASAWVLSLTCTAKHHAASIDHSDADHLDIEPDFSPTGISRLPAVFWKFIVMLLLFSVVIFMIRAVTVELHPVDMTLRGSSLTMFLRVVMALAFAALSLGFGSRRLNFGKIYSLVAVVTVVIIALLPMLGVLDANWNLIISAAIMLFEFTLWCLLAFISYQRATSSVVVIGLGYGVYMLGNTAGWFMGSSGLPHIIGGSMESIFYLVVAGVVLLSTFLLFSERDLERLLTPVDRGAMTLGELMLEDIAEGVPDRAATSQPAPMPSGQDAAAPQAAGQDALASGCEDALVDAGAAFEAGAAFGAGRSDGGGDADGSAGTQRRGRFMRQLDDLGAQRGLSKREGEVLRYLAMGRSSDFISEQLSISWNTARSHVHNIYVKLDVHSRQELIDLVDDLKKHPSA